MAFMVFAVFSAMSRVDKGEEEGKNGEERITLRYNLASRTAYHFSKAEGHRERDSRRPADEGREQPFPASRDLWLWASR